MHGYVLFRKLLRLIINYRGVPLSLQIRWLIGSDEISSRKSCQLVFTFDPADRDTWTGSINDFRFIFFERQGCDYESIIMKRETITRFRSIRLIGV